VTCAPSSRPQEELSLRTCVRCAAAYPTLLLADADGPRRLCASSSASATRSSGVSFQNSASRGRSFALRFSVGGKGFGPIMRNRFRWGMETGKAIDEGLALLGGAL
jgi:hypothetical protein